MTREPGSMVSSDQDLAARNAPGTAPCALVAVFDCMQRSHHLLGAVHLPATGNTTDPQLGVSKI